MKQKFRKLGALLLSMLLVFGIVSPVLAEETTPSTGSITIHKYEVEEHWRVDIDNTVTAVEQSVPETAKALSGVTFKIEKVEVQANMKNLDPDQVNDLSVETDTNGEAVYSTTQITDKDGTISLTDLPLGVYRITEQPTEAISRALDAFLVTIPFVNPADESELLYDAHVYPKNKLNGQPGINQWVTKVKNTSETIGYTDDEEKTAKFIIDIDVPVDIQSEGLSSSQGNTYAFKALFTVSNLLEVPEISAIKVSGVKGTLTPDKAGNATIISTESEKIASEEELNNLTVDKIEIGSGYTISSEHVYDDRSEWTGAETYTISFDNGPHTVWKDYNMIRIEYECPLSVEGRDLVNAGQPITASAVLNYTNSLGHVVYSGNAAGTAALSESSASGVSNEVEVHTTAIRLKKVDGLDPDIPLKGAVFGIYSDKSCSEASAVKDSNGNAITGTSGTDGIITFKGLPYGNTGDAYNTTETTTYYVKELTAPIGYELYKKVYEVKAGASSASDDAIVEVVNYQQFVLPGTGLTGTHLMIIGFVAITAGIVGVVILKKRHA